MAIQCFSKIELEQGCFVSSSSQKVESRRRRCHTRGMQETHPPLSDAFALFQAGQPTEALTIIQHHAAAGDPDALFTLADMHWRGVGVAQDLARGRELFGRASDAGQPMAVRACTNLLSSGIAGERNWARALERLEDEARTDGLRARMLSVIRAMSID